MINDKCRIKGCDEWEKDAMEFDCGKCAYSLELDPYAAQGWIYGSPEHDGWYWMMGYSPGLRHVECAPVMVEVWINNRIVFVKFPHFDYIIYGRNQVTAMFLPILPPEGV
jgi:hypothetical protein